MTRDGESNLADVPDHRLFARLRRLVKRRSELLVEIGTIIAELVRRDYSFRNIGRQAGFSHQNGYRWYLKAIEASDSATSDDSSESTD